MSNRGRRHTVFGSKIESQKEEHVSQNTSLPIVTDDIVEKLHDMTEDIMDLATMQMDFSGLQPYRLKRPVRLASSDMLRQWDRRIEHKRLKEHSATAMFSRELHLSPTSPEDARSSFYNNSPRNAAYGAYQHAKAGHVRLADYSYQLETEEEIDPHEDFTNQANYDTHINHLPTLQERLEERRRFKPMRAPVIKRKTSSEDFSNKFETTTLMGDHALDIEGIVPERSTRQTRMMNPTTGKKNSKGDHAKKVEGTYIVGHKHQTGHYMEKMPWFKTAKRYRPNNMKDQSRQTIDRFLSLEHVYGFNGQSKRNNLIYTGEGLDYVFTSASLGIVVDPSQEIGKQRYMSGHTDDIISIATFQIKKKRAGFSFVATGEIGRHPKIIVWKSDTMEVLQTLKNVHLKGIAQLAFSPSGSLLASIGLDVHNTLVIHNWKKGIEITRCATGENRVFGLSFQPDIALHLDDSRLVTCGKKHLKFWNRNPNGKNYSSRPAKFGKLGGKVSIVDVCFDFAGRCVSASNLGHLLIFPPKDNDSNMLPLNKGSIKNAHDGPINCVVTVSGGNKIVSGGVDGMIKVWLCPNDLHHQIKSYRSFDTILKIERIPSIQSISISGNKVRALIGTRGGDVLEMKISDGSLVKKKTINDRSLSW